MLFHKTRIWLAFPLALMAQVATAQTTATTTGTSTGSTSGFSVTLISINGKNVSNALNWLNRSDCEDNVPIQFRIEAIPAGTNYLDFWRATGNGGGDANCDQTNSRSGANKRCDFIDVASQGTGGNKTQIQVYPETGSPAIGVKDLLNIDCATAPLNFGQYFIYVIATSGRQTTGDVDPGSVYKLKLDVDVQASAAPTNFVVSTGYRSIPASWSPPSDNNIQNYFIYADGAGGNISCGNVDADGGVTGSMLVAGQSLPNPLGTITQILSVNGATPSGAKINLANVVQPNQSAIVGIVTQDQAGNVSVVSNLACATATPTYGLCDQKGVNCNTLGGVGCSLSPVLSAGKETSSAALGALLILGLSLWMRRNRCV